MVVNLEKRMEKGWAGELQVTVIAYRHKIYGGNYSRDNFLSYMTGDDIYTAEADTRK